MPKGDPPTDPLDPPRTVEEFRDRLHGLHGQLPRRLQQCADHVAMNLDRIALSTVAQVAEGAGVPPSAVMRFCQEMGFSGYAEMQRLFRAALTRAAPDYATRLANLKAGGGRPARDAGCGIRGSGSSVDGGSGARPERNCVESSS